MDENENRQSPAFTDITPQPDPVINHVTETPHRTVGKPETAWYQPLLSSFGCFLEILQLVIIVGVLSFLIRMYVVQPYYIFGSSMEPNLKEGQILLIDEISYRFRDPSRGDIVVLHPPRDTRDYIKRIVGLPGEKITITEDGKVLINDRVLAETYLDRTNQDTEGELELTLGEDEYFVLGDNRKVSNDSRGGVDGRTNEAENPWAIHKRDIVGKAFIRWWPLNQLSFITAPTYTF